MADIVFIEHDEEYEQIKGLLPEQVTCIHLDNTKKDGHIPKQKYLQDAQSHDLLTESIRWLKEWSNKKIIDGKTIKDLFMYQNVSLWWFADFWFFYHELHRMTIKEIIPSIHLIERVIEVEHPETICIIQNGSCFSDVLEQYCIQKKSEAQFFQYTFASEKIS